MPGNEGPKPDAIFSASDIVAQTLGSKKRRILKRIRPKKVNAKNEKNGRKFLKIKRTKKINKRAPGPIFDDTYLSRPIKRLYG